MSLGSCDFIIHRKVHIIDDSFSALGHDAVVLAKIEKLIEIIPVCPQAFNFPEYKGIDIENHPKCKDKYNFDLYDMHYVEGLR